jgi:hypothetical protein
MTNALGVVVSMLCFSLGAVLLYDGISDPHSQAMTVVGGATFISIGLITVSLVLKNWMDERRNYKSFREE